MPDAVLHLHFANLHVDNSSLAEDHELLLRVVADFRISVAGKVLYEEPEFCVVEFGVQAIEWVRKLVHHGDFIYRTMEAEEPGFVWVKRHGTGWQIGSIYQSSEATEMPLNVIASAIEDYWLRLHKTVGERFGRDIGTLLPFTARLRHP